jgi:hypothetical protein
VPLLARDGSGAGAAGALSGCVAELGSVLVVSPAKAWPGVVARCVSKRLAGLARRRGGGAAIELGTAAIGGPPCN